MARKVILSPRAIQDLNDIVTYIAQDSSERAAKFGSALLSRTKQLAEFPETGRIVPEYRDPMSREIIFHSIRIIYRLSRDGLAVEVSRFWHASRGTPQP